MRQNQKAIITSDGRADKEMDDVKNHILGHDVFPRKTGRVRVTARKRTIVYIVYTSPRSEVGLEVWVPSSHQ